MHAVHDDVARAQTAYGGGELSGHLPAVHVDDQRRFPGIVEALAYAHAEEG